jgi:AraC family transcriptional regulator
MDLRELQAVPNSFSGIICVGLFPKPIPMRKPVGCTILFQSGEFWIPDIPDGTYYVMAVTFAWEDSIHEYLNPQNVLRGKSNGEIIIAGGMIKGETSINVTPTLIL